MKTNQQSAPKLSLKKSVITRFSSPLQVQQGKITKSALTSLDTWTSFV
jgi:hypothetical protein